MFLWPSAESRSFALVNFGVWLVDFEFTSLDDRDLVTLVACLTNRIINVRSRGNRSPANNAARDQRQLPFADRRWAGCRWRAAV